MVPPDQVDYVSGKTRLFGIVGHPIEQVRSPEMITAELKGRGHDAILVPMHVLPDHFDAWLTQMKTMPNLGGLVFTIPYKVRASGFADHLGPQALLVGAINAIARAADGRWHAEIFDGLGCVEAFRRRGLAFAGKRVMLLGAGGAGSAIAAAVAAQSPAALALYDVDGDRAQTLAATIAAANPGVVVTAGAATIDGIDYLLNASPVGMLADSRLPVPLTTLPRSLVVFDAIVKPEVTPLLALATQCGCTAFGGREMMRGQIARMADFFYAA
jgi:shikimate dehydrogenase